MTGLAYTRFELRRTFRNRRFLFFSLGFPIALFFLIAGPNKNEHDLGGTGISAPLYYMVALAAFGTMMGMVSTGARIAGERQVGWTRQLRVTPLSSAAYLRADPGRPVGRDDAADRARADAVRGARDLPRPPAERRLDRAGDRRQRTILAFVGGTWFPVTSGWTIVLSAAAAWAYRRDTGRT